jgi:hypothetical protein
MNSQQQNLETRAETPEAKKHRAGDTKNSGTSSDLEAVESYTTALKMWSNGLDTFIAKTWDDVQMLFEDHVDPQIGLDRSGWSVLPASQPITIKWNAEKEGVPDEVIRESKVPEKAQEAPEHDQRVTATADQWAMHMGKAFCAPQNGKSPVFS